MARSTVSVPRRPLPPEILPGGRYDEWRPPSAPTYVLCDVDGTLVGPHDLATAEVVDAVRDLQELGVRIGYATGRMGKAVAQLHDQLDARGPHVLHNGAQVRVDGKTVASWPLRDEQVDGLLALAHERDDLYAEVYTESRFHVSAWDERARPHWVLLDSAPSSIIGEVRELRGEPVLKVTFTAFAEQAVGWLVDRIGGLGLLAGPAGSPRTPGMTYVNATRSDADKGEALIRAASHLGVELADVVAIGDASNDLPMLAVAGTAIAMGQAEAPIQAAAHVVVPHVDAHGVAVALSFVASCRAA